MNQTTSVPFLTYYIRSLTERSRREKTGTKYGFDWVIYNLGLAEDLIPYRLPFIRGGPDEMSKTKTEAEFGIDCAFLSPDAEELTIFVLKDEVLNNRNWKEHDFDADLRSAAAVNLMVPDLLRVKRVKVVLAYNKDEDSTGVQLFSNLTNALGTKVGDRATLSFERWNLSTITEKTRLRLLTPALLPQRFFSLFNYICAQFADFRHGSDEWTNQLVPNWQRFLKDVLDEQADERSVHLIPVALIILRQFGSTNPTVGTGWIDLAEWAMLAVWRFCNHKERHAIEPTVYRMWVELYLAELDAFYSANHVALATENSLDLCRSASYLDAVASAVVAHWHVARIGILALAWFEVLREETPEERTAKGRELSVVADWMASLLCLNSGAKRPLLDIHHIELFLGWYTLWQVARVNDLTGWLYDLLYRLFLRRVGVAELPFLEGNSSLELVFEFVATKSKPFGFLDESSSFLLILMELCCCLQPDARAEHLSFLYQKIVLALGDDGEPLRDRQPMDLMVWIPPIDWATRVLEGSLADDGECQVLHVDASISTLGCDVAENLLNFVEQSRATDKGELSVDAPVAVLVLACLKHQSPLPPELWRSLIFGPRKSSSSANGAETGVG